MGDDRVLRFRPKESELTWTFGGCAPVEEVPTGSIIELWTEDAFGGRITSTSDLPSRLCDPSRINPQTGPFFVPEAEPGDTLAVHFISIEPARTTAFSAIVPFFGSLTSTVLSPSLQIPLEEHVWRYDLDLATRVAHLAKSDAPSKIALPLDPMHGTVGVAPAGGEVRSSLVPGVHGGNMDTPEMRRGVTCFLGVNVVGAMLSLGDGHARQGEGESCGVALETAMDTVVAVDLLKAHPCPTPRLETDSLIMVVGSGRPLEEAVRVAHRGMIDWLSHDFGFEALDAYQFITQAAETSIANVCNPNYTAVVKLRKKWLPRIETMRGLHRRLRHMGESLSAQPGTVGN